jgi:hypothetical protein
MRIRLKINPKTGVIYFPKQLVEDGFKGEVDVFSAGPVVVIVHPDAEVNVVREGLELVSRDIELTPRMRPMF